MTVIETVNRLVEIEDLRRALEKEAIELGVQLKPKLHAVAYGQMCCLSFMPNTRDGNSKREKAHSYFINEYQAETMMPGITTMSGMMPGM